MKFKTQLPPELSHLIDLDEFDIEQLNKSLKSLKLKLEKKVDARNILNGEINKLTSVIGEIDTKIKYIKSIPTDTQVSDHAIVRYIERVKGINLDDIKNDILTDSVKRNINKVGDCKITTNDGNYIIVRNNIVVSIVPI